jgi:superfamily I DNA and/or RNA helicase
MRRRLQEQTGCEGIHCGSVVTAQGSEWDYVLLSTVLNARQEGGRGHGGHGFSPLGCLADRHLLNVAVTRGRLGIVVLGSPETLRGNPHWEVFLRQCEENGGLLEGATDPNLFGSEAGHHVQGA